MNSNIGEYSINQKKPTALVCPTCSIKKNKTIRSTACGTCKNCQELTFYLNQSYCTNCSNSLHSCCECGQTIKNGDYYIENLERIISLEIKNEKHFMQKETNDNYIQCHIKLIDNLEKELNRTKKMYNGKTVEQMIEIIGKPN